jgi:hypothetical protein
LGSERLRLRHGIPRWPDDQPPGQPDIRLRYHLDNFIVGRKLVGQLTGKAETWRLRNENSEDALSFNVFRSFQEAGVLRQAASVLTGLEFADEPDLIVWSHRLGRGSAATVSELKAVLDEIEGTKGQQTEPDVILRVPGWGWIFVEAKLASPTSTYKARSERLVGWRVRYGKSKAFNQTALAAADPSTFPEQLLRKVAVAHRLAAGEHVAIVALVREVYLSAVTDWATEYLAGGAVIARAATWEQLYTLTDGNEHLANLRDYSPIRASTSVVRSSWTPAEDCMRAFVAQRSRDAVTAEESYVVAEAEALAARA